MEKEEKQSLDSIPIGFQVLEESEVNDTRFTRVKIWLLHLGYSEERNIYFPKEVVDEAIPTLKNTPIIARLKLNKTTGEVDFSNHNPRQRFDGKIILDTDVIGVIPESNKAKYEKRVCDDYVEREFLTVEGILWDDRADREVEILKKAKIKYQSMELDGNLTEYKVDEEGRLVPIKMGFNGACILGDHERPAVINSTLELFSKTEIEVLSDEIAEKLQNYYSANKGGVEEVEKTENTDTTIEKTDEKVEDTTQEEKSKDTTVENDTKEAETNPENIGEDEKNDKKQGEDKQPEKQAKIEEKAEEKVEEKAETEKNKKPEEPQEANTKDTTNGKAKLPVNFSKEELDGILAEVEELREFKSKVESEKRKEQEQVLFSKYQALGDLEEFKSIKERASDFTLEELDREFALVYANNADALKFSSNIKKEETEKEDETSFLFSKALEKNTSNKYGNLLEKHDLNNLGNK